MIVSFRCVDQHTQNFIEAIMMVAKITSSVVADMSVTIDPVFIPTIPKRRGRGPTVQYSAISGAEALEAIGATTVQGIIYSYLLANGPCTAKHLREHTTYSMKSIESTVDKLKDKGVVVATPITPSVVVPTAPLPNIVINTVSELGKHIADTDPEII